jgi:hypothetical protein
MDQVGNVLILPVALLPYFWIEVLAVADFTSLI